MLTTGCMCAKREHLNTRLTVKNTNRRGLLKWVF